MSVNFYDSDQHGPIDSNVAGKPHGLDISENDGKVIITITPFGETGETFRMLPTREQLREMVTSLLDAAEFIGVLTAEEVSNRRQKKV